MNLSVFTTFTLEDDNVCTMNTVDLLYKANGSENIKIKKLTSTDCTETFLNIFEAYVSRVEDKAPLTPEKFTSIVGQTPLISEEPDQKLAQAIELRRKIIGIVISRFGNSLKIKANQFVPDLDQAYRHNIKMFIDLFDHYYEKKEWDKAFTALSEISGSIPGAKGLLKLARTYLVYNKIKLAAKSLNAIKREKYFGDLVDKNDLETLCNVVSFSHSSLFPLLQNAKIKQSLILRFAKIFYTLSDSYLLTLFPHCKDEYDKRELCCKIVQLILEDNQIGINAKFKQAMIYIDLQKGHYKYEPLEKLLNALISEAEKAKKENKHQDALVCIQSAKSLLLMFRNLPNVKAYEEKLK